MKTEKEKAAKGHQKAKMLLKAIEGRSVWLNLHLPMEVCMAH
jgi:hypothetical protein